jgi:AraC family transcriptional regulator, positive regulator of tynA and feaB
LGLFAGTPHLSYEAWRASLRSACGGDPKIMEPKAFAGWMRPLSVCGFTAAAAKIECDLGATDLGCNSYRMERMPRDVRRAGLEDYWAAFQVAGRSELIQNDQAVELAVGDVALIDTTRPSTFSHNGSAQCLFLYLPRQSLVSHLGLEPLGGACGRGEKLATRLLDQLVRDAIEDEASLSAPTGTYLQLAVYDLLGALFAPSDPIPGSLHADKLFRRICSIINDRFADPDFGPRDVAAQMGISQRYLNKLFAARGLTCNRFILSFRLDHAARLLRRRASLKTGLSISEIAYVCGFNDYRHFSRKFYRRFGNAPSAIAGDQ